MVTNPVLAVVVTYLLYFFMLLAQVLLAARAGLLGPVQRNRDTEALPLVAYGGTWTTYLIVLPFLMYMVGTYGPHWREEQVKVALIVAVVLAALWNLYDSAKTPEGTGQVNGPYRKGGTLTPCGWLRLLQTVLTLAVLCVFFIDRQVSLRTHLVATGFLTLHVILGTHFGLRAYAAYKKWGKDGYRGRDVIAFVFDGPAFAMVALCSGVMVGMSLVMNR